MACFGYLIILSVYGILIGVWIYSFVFFRMGIRKKRPVMKWVAFVPLSLITGLFFIGIFNIVRSHVPSYVYAETFGEKPSDDVSGIKSDNCQGFESDHTYLQFYAKRSTFERICPSRLKAVTYEEFVKLLPSDIIPRPKWWIKVSSEMTIRLFLVKGEICPNEVRLLTYDEESGIVQYFFIEIWG